MSRQVVAKASEIAQGYRYGAIDCLTKPLAPAAVLSRVEAEAAVGSEYDFQMS